jgi:thioredoxin reductase
VTESITRVVRSGKRIRGLELANGDTLDAEKLFFTIAQYPADDLGAQLGCERDRGGHLVVSPQFETSVPGVYAAGDITPGPQLAIRAAGSGATAALYLHKSLVPEYRKL